MLKTYNKHNLEELKDLKKELEDFLETTQESNRLFCGSIAIREKHPNGVYGGKIWKEEYVDSIEKCNEIISYVESLIITNNIELQIDYIKQ